MCSIFQCLGRQMPLQYVVVSEVGTKVGNKGGFLLLRCWDQAWGSWDSPGGQPATQLLSLLTEVPEQGQTLSVVPALCLARKPDRNESLQPDQCRAPRLAQPRAPQTHQHPSGRRTIPASEPSERSLFPLALRQTVPLRAVCHTLPGAN